VEQIARLARLSFDGAAGDAVASVAIPGGKIEILGSDELDPEAAARKRAAQVLVLKAEIERSQGKLANEGFVSKAPPAVVQAERDKLERLRADLQALEEEP